MTPDEEKLDALFRKTDEEVDRIFDPTHLTAAATKPATMDLLSEINSRKPRGRPVGSRNRTKVDPGQIGSGPQQLVTPSRRTASGPGPSGPEKPDPIKMAQAKRDKTEAYTKRIVDELNDNLMLVFISIGVPSNFIYQPGKTPQEVKVSEKYTEFGNAIAIKPSQAKALASFAAELEFTDAGGKLAASAGTGYGPLVVKGVLALVAVGQYMRTLNDMRTRIEPMMKAWQDAQTQQKTGGNSNQRPAGGLQ